MNIIFKIIKYSFSGSKAMPNKELHYHDGHRERLRERFLKFGSDAFTEHELLELFLTLVIPRVNTNDIAHRLIYEYGSLTELFSTTSPSKMIKGVGDKTKLFIKVVAAIFRRIQMPAIEKVKFDSLYNVGDYLVKYYSKVETEQLCAMFFDASMRLLRFQIISEGGANDAIASYTAIARCAVMEDAAGVIIAHNHPRGSADSSGADREFTKKLEAALAAVRVSLIEHIIVGETGYRPTLMVQMNALRTEDSVRQYNEIFLKKFYGF